MKYRVKLAAIAKDEAAYLPEWIHHHLYFGFDHIEIYINNTLDNSYSIVDKIRKNHLVKAIDADPLVVKYKVDFQTKSYQDIAMQAKKDGFTHVMFLDIDEFWTPKDFKTSIGTAIAALPKSDVYLFNWFIHTDERYFGPCFDYAIRGRFDKHVKYLVDLRKEFRPEVHNAIGRLRYCHATGKYIKFGKKDQIRAFVPRVNDMVDDYFITHRLYRSQKEYISLLFRGRAKGDAIKNNRFGYYKNSEKTKKIEFEKCLIDKYLVSYGSFKNSCLLGSELVEAQDYVEQRYRNLIEFAENTWDKDTSKTLLVALQNISLPEILSLRKFLMANNNRKIFQIGFNKAGTASIYHYMKGNGFASIHWDKGRLSKQLQQNKKMGKPLLEGYEEYQVFTDMEHREKDKSAFYAYQHYFKELDQQYPHSIFILNYRSIDKWIKSRLEHPGYLDKTSAAMGLSKEEIIDQWTQHFNSHINDVNAYFKGKDNLITINLDKDNKNKLYDELTKRGFRLSKKDLPHTHKTKKSETEIQKEHINNIRSAAIYYEKSDLNVSLSLMTVAQKLRPSGTLIKDKIAQYKKELNL